MEIDRRSYGIGASALAMTNKKSKPNDQDNGVSERALADNGVKARASTSERTTPTSIKLPLSLLNVPSNSFDSLKEINFDNKLSIKKKRVAKAEYEKRKMFRAEHERDIRAICRDFFICSVEELRSKITPMSHSMRYWLCVKFFNDAKFGLLHNKLSQATLCKLFGLNVNSVRDYIRLGNLNSENMYAKLLECRGMSPIESSHRRDRKIQILLKYAKDPTVVYAHCNNLTTEKRSKL